MQKIFEYWYINCINTGFRDTNSALGKPAYQISQMLNQWTLPLVVVRTDQYTCCPEHIGYTRLAKEDWRIGNYLKDTFLTFSLQPKMTILKTSWFNRLQRNSRKNYTFWYSRKSRDYRINVNRSEKRSVTLNIFTSRNPHHKGFAFQLAISSWSRPSDTISCDVVTFDHLGLAEKHCLFQQNTVLAQPSAAL